MYVRAYVYFLVGSVNTVHSAPWPHCPNWNVFNDRRNSFYDKSASFRCDGRLFDSPGPAAENALSPKGWRVQFICGQFIFYLGSQSVTCTASLAALRLYGYFCDFCFVFVSENKYDDDDERCCMSVSRRMFGSLWNVGRRSRASATRWQSSASYGGKTPDNDWWTNVATLKWTRWRTGS